MTEISASAVKELRERTGAGMMDCKKALVESNGNMEEAIDWLRKKGLAKAAKKAGRSTAEGLVAISVAGNVGAIVEVNAETDFVARNEQFQEYVRTVAGLAVRGIESVDALKALDYPGVGRTVDEELANLIAVIGENMNLRRAQCLKVEEGVIASYIHNALAENMGRVGVLVALKSQAADKAALEKLGKSIAMHIAAAHPQAVSIESLDPEALARERRVLSEKAQQSGNRPEVIEKMVEGGIRKFYEEVVLLEQLYLLDDTKRKVAAVIADKEKELGSSIQVVNFVHYKLGEGVEKKNTDFAAEVAELAK
jgi:elongation factor Ts